MGTTGPAGCGQNLECCIFFSCPEWRVGDSGHAGKEKNPQAGPLNCRRSEASNTVPVAVIHDSVQLQQLPDSVSNSCFFAPAQLLHIAISLNIFTCVSLYHQQPPVYHWSPEFDSRLPHRILNFGLQHHLDQCVFQSGERKHVFSTSVTN